jgi:hypothetical protein
MKKAIGVVLAVVLCGAVLSAQDDLVRRIDPVRAYDGVVDFQKTTQVAKIFEFNYPAKELENAVQGYLASRGAKVRGVKGFSLAKTVMLSDADDRAYDVYYKVEGKGKGDKAVSTLFLILADPDEDILQRAKPEPGTASTEGLPAFSGRGAFTFIDSLGTIVADHEYARFVASLEDDLRKAEKRFKSLVDEGQSLARKKERLEQDIRDNFDAQTKQSSEVERARMRLEQAKAKGKGY